MPTYRVVGRALVSHHYIVKAKSESHAIRKVRDGADDIEMIDETGDEFYEDVEIMEEL